MRVATVMFFCALVLNSCKESNKEPLENENMATVEYMSFGKKIIQDDAIKATSMASHYRTMRIGDSIQSKMIATVNKVCQAKGCWMTLSLSEGEEVMVKLKDYGFFVPKDIKGKEVIVNGLAFVNEVSVEEQRHYAKDAEKSEAEINAITKPKRSYSFIADGVLLKQ